MVESDTIHVAGKSNIVWSPIPYRISAKRLENDNLFTLQLDPAGDMTIDPIAPGQFNMLYSFGIGEIPISVSSRLSSHPTLTHSIQDVGPVSKALTQLVTGDVVGVRGPFGTTWPIEKAKSKDILILAGGIGLCPLRPVIEHILDHRDQYGEVNVLFGTRHPDNIIYHSDIISWQSDSSINFQITVDHAFANWRGNVGVVTHLINKAIFDPANTAAFLCGPEVMMRFGVYSCLDAGVAEEAVHLSMERNMKCAIGFCGHCQLGPYFTCKDGAVFPYTMMKPYLNIPEL
ncbi:MAG: FAD/NAD(P)-binding protein [Cyclobacteriaceae bacterium]